MAIRQPSVVLRQTKEAPLRSNSLPSTVNLVAILLAIAVYCFARSSPPELFESFKTTFPILAAQTALFGSAPAFFYTLSIGLLVGACAAKLRDARLHCILWVTLALFLELLQLPTLSRPISTWLASILSETSWEIVRPYRTRGVFDHVDMLATLMGGLLALFFAHRLSGSKRYVPDQ